MEEVEIGRSLNSGKHCSLEDCNLDRIDSMGAVTMEAAVNLLEATRTYSMSSGAEVQGR